MVQVTGHELCSAESSPFQPPEARFVCFGSYHGGHCQKSEVDAWDDALWRDLLKFLKEAAVVPTRRFDVTRNYIDSIGGAVHEVKAENGSPMFV